MLEGLNRWCEVLEGAASTMLLVMSKLDVVSSPSCPDTSGYEALRAACFEWALDNGFELIDANCLDVEAGGSNPRDKTGVPRVIEALESTMWSNMAMKPRGGGSSGAGGLVTKPVVPMTDGSDAVSSGMLPLGFVTPIVPTADTQATQTRDSNSIDGNGVTTGTESKGTDGYGDVAEDEDETERVVLEALTKVKDSSSTGTNDVKLGAHHMPLEAEYESMLDNLDDVMQQVCVGVCKAL